MLTNSYFDEILTKVHEANEKTASYDNQDMSILEIKLWKGLNLPNIDLISPFFSLLA